MSHSSTPAPERARVEIEFRSATVAIVRLVGEHDLSQVNLLKDAFATSCARRQHVLVDLSRCAFLDSTIIHALLQAQSEVTSDEGHFALVVPDAGSHPGRILELMQIGEAVPIFATINQALASVEHAIRIRDMRERSGAPDAFAAECSCGWQGELRRGLLAMKAARGDGDQHAGYRNPTGAR